MRLNKYKNSSSSDVLVPAVKRYVMYCRKSSESDERQVQSLPDQIVHLTKLTQQLGIQLVGQPIQESRTAKVPGRPLFNQVIQMIEDGKANGIVLLNPSRLSRNTVDTGRVIYLMDQGKLLEVVTPATTYRNVPDDKFMLNLLCSQAKLENDNKSVNVTEALRLKAERGVFPGKARPGYINNHWKPQGLRDISPHPVFFNLMRKLFDLALTGNYSVERLVVEAANLGIRSSKGGKPICKSWMYRLVRDPFYTGRFIYNDKIYKGQHPAMLTDNEFNVLQDIVDGRSKPRLQRHDFALTGIIKCGVCKYCITAEEKTKKYKNGTIQVFKYYRCTSKGKVKCHQPYTQVKKLEGQFASELSQLELESPFKEWAFKELELTKEKDNNANKDSFEALKMTLDGVNKRLDNLIVLKISPDNSDGVLLSDAEFSDRKRGLLFEKEQITEQLAQKDPSNTEWAEIAKDSFDFSLKAYEWFQKGDSEDKKVIFKAIGSDPILLDQNLQFQLRMLFVYYKKGVKTTNEEKGRLSPENGSTEQSNLNFYLKSSLWSPGAFCFELFLPWIYQIMAEYQVQEESENDPFTPKGKYSKAYYTKNVN